MRTQKKVVGFILLLVLAALGLHLLAMLLSPDEKTAITGPSRVFMPKPQKEPPAETQKDKDSREDQKEEEKQSSKKEDPPPHKPSESETPKVETPGEKRDPGHSPAPAPPAAPVAPAAPAQSAESAETSETAPAPLPVQVVRASEENNTGDAIALDEKTDIMPIPDTVSLQDQEFTALDMAHQDIINEAASIDKTGKYGWGLLGRQNEPDLPVRTLGGIPFAVDPDTGALFHINLDKGEAKYMLQNNSYSSLGVDAHDAKLRKVVKKAAQKGMIQADPDNLTYCYLFYKDTDDYIRGKVALAFEWYIQHSGFHLEQSENFRKNARLRLRVIKVKRHGSGQMGAVVPKYFMFQSQKAAMPAEYYQTDKDAQMLGLAP